MNDYPERVFLVAYDEIGLKGKNKHIFIQKMIHNISEITGINNSYIRHSRGRIYILLQDHHNAGAISNVLSEIFGIKWFALADVLPLDFDTLKRKSVERAQQHGTDGKQTFKVEARRGNKDFYLTSPQINNQLGETIRVNSELEVDIHHPEVTFYVEVRKERIFLHTEHHNGPGGLPTGSNGKVLCLISGGIDSPVAAWYMMKRGLAVDYVYFHSPPYTGEKVKEKVRSLTRQLQKWNVEPVRLFIPYFTTVQEEMAEQVSNELWTVVQRRYMHRVANKIAHEHGYQAVVTGDSLGQVASQTMSNLNLIDAASDKIILRPLIGLDKQEIIERARLIGTFDISIQPFEDCCVLFAPKNPSTNTKAYEIEAGEEAMDSDRLIGEALGKMESETVTYELQGI